MANMSQSAADKEYYSWNEYQADIVTLAERIRENLTPQPSGIYGIPRGGLVLAVSSSHLLGIPIVLFREEIKPDTLIVDDTADTGETLDEVCEQLGFQVMIAKLYYCNDSVLRPSVFIRLKTNWIVFPWESEVSSKYDRTESIGKS
jgi:hypoxanthine phosphoribosyltransferase